MAGNVWEWVSDWLAKDPYRRSSERNPRGPETGDRRVVRGGAWNSYPVSLRSAFRDSNPPDDRSSFLGFRCARGTASALDSDTRGIRRREVKGVVRTEADRLKDHTRHLHFPAFYADAA